MHAERIAAEAGERAILAKQELQHDTLATARAADQAHHLVKLFLDLSKPTTPNEER